MRRLPWVLAILAFARQGFAGDADVAQFQREYPDAGRRLVQFAETLSGTIDIVETDIVRKTTTRRSGDFQADRGLFRFVMKGTKSQTTSAAGFGPDGMYRLIKDPSDPEDSFGVISLGGTPTDRETLNQNFGRYLHASHSMGGTDLAKVIRAPDVRNLTVEPVQVEGRSLKRVKFEVGPEVRVNRASADLDPSASWAIVDWTYEVRSKQDGRFSKASGSVEYGPLVDGMAVPKTIRIDDVGGQKYLVAFSDLSRPSVPSERFAMSSFGLPNLVKLETPRMSWISIAAIGLGSTLCVGCAVALVARGRRRKGVDLENVPTPG